MLIAQLDITNFRGIREGRVRFETFTVLIGANNCGKTTITEALALLFGRDRLVRALTEHDFFGSMPQTQDRIQIVATITGFNPNDPSRYLDWFRMGRAIPKWWNPQTATLKPNQESDTDQLACQICFTARFDRETLEVETIRCFYDDECEEDPFSEDSAITPLPIPLVREMGFFLVPREPNLGSHDLLQFRTLPSRGRVRRRKPDRRRS
jgi:putative ATP-dependent endonuclease of the OLD family